MTFAPAVERTAAPSAPSTPLRRRRTVWVWIAIGLVLLLVGAAGAAVTSATEWTRKGLLDPASAGPAGTRALVQILGARGIQVDIVRSLDAARSAIGPDDTLVIASAVVLSDDALSALAARAGDVILVDPGSRDARILLDGADAAGFGSDAEVAPDCDLPDATRAGSIVVGSLLTRGATEGTIGCYPVDGDFGLIAVDRSPTSRTVAIDARGLFSNDGLDVGGNAALALSLMGRHPHLVWYMPSPADSDLGDSAPSIGDLTPPWVTPAIVLLLCAGIVAAIWRGRRFGPLVAETLPVTVRASETMEGRARLYARSRDAGHALDALRGGVRERIATLLGLGPTASAAAVADAAADRLGAPRPMVRSILIDAVPSTEADLVSASDRLRDLEAAVRASVTIERTDT